MFIVVGPTNVLAVNVLTAETSTTSTKYGYTLDQSSTTGWWHWTCKDGSNQGWLPTKSAARKEGRKECGTAISSFSAWISSWKLWW